MLATSGAGRRERRVISVLFCDLVGFTGRAETLDVEDVDQFLSSYHQLFRRTLERHGATVEKFIGDAVMAVFGAPRAHEDDAERAVRAALSIQVALADLRDGGEDVHVRVGITTGEALVAFDTDPATGEGMTSGDVVNTAARLQAAAPPDSVLVDERTHRLTRAAIRYHAAEPVVAKGKREPVPAWHAVETRTPVHGRRPADKVALVARTDVLERLEAVCAESRDRRSVRLMTLVGPPGIGKSRVVEELRSRSDAVWRSGRCLAYGDGVSFWPLSEIVTSEAGVLDSDTPDQGRAKLERATAAVLDDADERAWVLRHLEPLIGVRPHGTASGGGDETAEAFAAWRRYLEALAQRTRLVVVFEDVHWADEELVSFIGTLASRITDAPLAIVCTTRPELLDRPGGWMAAQPNAHTLVLAPLDPDETRLLVARLLDEAPLPRAVREALVERAEGNPLYAGEYVRMLKDQGLLVRGAAGWRLDAPPEHAPESVQAIIAARLDTLDTQQRRFIADAAVIGRSGFLGTVCALGGQSPWQADEVLHQLEQKQLVQCRGRPTVAGEVEWSFAHALIQDVAYRQIRRADRADRHERAGAWFDALAGGRGHTAQLRAHHYGAALALRRALGQDASKLEPSAQAAFADAGRQSLAVAAYPAAAAYLDAALELTPNVAPDRRRLVLDHATAHHRAGTATETLLRDAADTQVSADDWAGAAAACALLAFWLSNAARDNDADEVIARGLGYASRGVHTHAESQLAAMRVRGLLSEGDTAAALTLAEAVMRRAEQAGDEAGRAVMLGVHGEVLVATRGDASGLTRLSEAAETLARLAHPDAPIVQHNLAELLVGWGDYRASRQVRRDAHTSATRTGQAFEIAFTRVGLAEAAYDAGEWDEAVDLVGAIPSHPSEHAAAYARWVRGRILVGRGDFETAAADADFIRAVAGEDREALIAATTLRTLALQASTEESEIVAAAAEPLAVWREMHGSLPSASVVCELCRIPALRPLLGDAAAMLPSWSPWHQALAASAAGRDRDAAVIFAEIGARMLEAAALAAAAAAGDATAAEAARRIYEQTGATFYASRIPVGSRG
jgi:predicted ATPase/class 3 adenylate cyclase